VAVRLLYMDDSGTVDTGLISYSWLNMDIAEWNRCPRLVLDWRHRISQQHGIPVRYELHSTKFLGGRGDPSLDPRWNRSKANRNAVVIDGLAQLAGLPSVQLGTAYRRTTATGRRYGSERADVYVKTVELLDAMLTDQGDIGIIVMGGNGTDPSYRQAHRSLKLATRSIIEDPTFQPAHESQLVQRWPTSSPTCPINTCSTPRTDGSCGRGSRLTCRPSTSAGSHKPSEVQTRRWPRQDGAICEDLQAEPVTNAGWASPPH